MSPMTGTPNAGSAPVGSPVRLWRASDSGLHRPKAGRVPGSRLPNWAPGYPTSLLGSGRSVSAVGGSQAMADVGDRVEMLSKSGTRQGVVRRVSGTLVTVEWDTGGQTTVIP